ncbi:MAG: hypothetical protein MMC23_007180 [Stictis urceolatum]|nr:hypothetical protein [Stictis urceolata]
MRTVDEFLQMLRAIATSPSDTPSPSPKEQFLGAHPKALEFVTSQKPALASYTEPNFFGVNVFKLIPADDKGAYIRYRIVPNAPSMSGFSAERLSDIYFLEEITQHLLGGPVTSTLLAQMAEYGDITDDATAYRLADRNLVELGTISIETVLEDGMQVAKQTIFGPVTRVQGIEASEDPLLEVREGAYLIATKQRRTE